MKNKEKIIVFWGIMDLAAVGWYFVFNIAKGKLPFYSDIVAAKATSVTLGFPFPLVAAFVSLILYVSLLFSGCFLINRKKLGAILSYFQCPFRLIAFIPISLFFLTWPLKYIFGVPSQFVSPVQTFMQVPVIVHLCLVILSELIKTTTVIRWHTEARKKV